MDSKIAYAIIVALVVSVAILGAGLLYLQTEINSLKPAQPTPTVGPTAAQTGATPTYTPQPTSKSDLRYSYVVYEFRLKSDYINNQTWLSGKVAYNQSLSWKENYFAYLARCTVYPVQMRDSMASMMFDTNEFVSAEFDSTTGATKVTYNYLEYNGLAEYYSIEYNLPNIIADGTSWNKNYV
ncbi:MAG: hypothetical protein ACQCN4_04570 [Candidatus Bathyarchaeia archaeon]|jgi:hypothetical protein